MLICMWVYNLVGFLIFFVFFREKHSTMAEIVEQAQEREACHVCVESVLEFNIYHRFNSHHASYSPSPF